MKLNKNTHFFIITTFAIVFIIVYLYYTITDVRRLSTDVARLSRDLTLLTDTVKAQKQEVVTETHPLLIQVPASPKAQEEEPIDITKILSDISHEEESVTDTGKQEDTKQDESKKEEEPTDFSNMKYEDLKDLCKKNNLSTKGTKAELTQRLLGNIQESS